MDNAIVHGQYAMAVAVFVEDAHGDLVDIEHYCLDCARERGITGDWWPAFDFGNPDSTFCHDCEVSID